MRRSRLVLVLVPVSVLVYLLFLKRHYDSQNALLPLRPPGPAPGARLAPDWTRRSDGQVRFGIMFDAGSTGTRVHIYRFRLDQTHGLPQMLEETFKAIKPGLSAFADDPEQVQSGLEQLLDLARSTVPAQFWKTTPVYLRATAGLRLLQEDQAQRLLDQVRFVLGSSPFFSEDHSVSILDGTDEGISAWITVNYLLGALHGSSPGPGSGPGSPQTVGMLDLGGGSTQVTFSPQNQDTLQTSDSIQTFSLFNSSYSLYTHSYLGLGLMSARAKILGVTSDLAGGAVLHSPCFTEDFNTTWEHNQKIYHLRGHRTESRFQACWSRVQDVMDSVTRVSDTHLFYASSFYYDRAVDIRAIDPEAGGVVDVRQYESAAQRVCASEVQDQDPTRSDPGPDQDPFLCLDLVYISVLLQNLGFSPNSQLKLSRTINDVETSWTLGATFRLLF